MLDTIRRNVAALIPGTAINIAQQKRRMERDLQKQGLSRSHAQAIVAEHFKQKQSPLQN